MTDIHYAQADNGIGRDYRNAPQKMADALAVYNADPDVDFVIVTGDLINGNTDEATTLAELETIEATYDNATMSRYYVFGNHDLHYNSRAQFIAATGMEDAYYSFVVGGVTYVVLDANYEADDDASGYDHTTGTRNAYIPPAERTWLQGVLDGASGPVVVFSHQRLDSVDESWGIQNSPVIRAMLEAYTGGKVFAFFGHNHINGARKINGVLYVEIDAMADGDYPTNAYSLVKLYDNDSIEIVGYGGQQDWVIF